MRIYRWFLVCHPLKDRNRRLAWAQDYRAMRFGQAVGVGGEAAVVLAANLHPEVATYGAGLL